MRPPAGSTRSPGYWEGSYFAGGEGNLRTPCIARWPGRIQAGRTSDEIMHVTDWFTTILHAGRHLAARGVHLLDGPQMYGVKWRNFKLVLVAQKYMHDPAAKLPTRRLINLATDLHERETVSPPYLHTWTAAHFNKIIGEFEASLHREPAILMGAPLDHVPKPPA
ncbi:MAG TPA: hypothetical protein VF162_00410 [Streptosporangiaceae bacterium]